MLMQTERLPLISLVCVVSLFAGSAGGEVSIRNAFLDVRVDTERNLFDISSVKTGEAVVSGGSFSRKTRSAEARPIQDPTLGAGDEILVAHTDGSRTSIRLFKNSPFACARQSVHNPGTENLDLESVDLLDLKTGPLLQGCVSFGTGGLRAPSDGVGSYSFHVFADPDTRRGLVTAWLTHEVGVGVFFPRADGDGAAVKTQLDVGLFRVKPGADRDTDTLLVGYFDDARLGLEAYADAVAARYRIALKPKPGVYCTWYHAGASSEARIAENTEFAAAHLKPFGLSVMQIDDKWQALLPKGFHHDGRIQTTGPVKVFVDSNDNYSSGMAHTAQAIASRGMVPGIWFMPFAGNFRNPYFDPEIFAKNPDGTPFHDARWSGTCIDLSQPKARQFVFDRTRRIYDWGYRYFKIDGMHTGMPSYNIYVNTSYKKQDLGKARLFDPETTLVQAYRKGLATLHEAAPDAFILGCNVSQNMMSMGPAFGLIDAMRIGPDNGRASKGDWKAVTMGAWHGSNLYFLNGRIWHNDPDPVYVRPGNPLERAHWMCSWMAVAGAMHTSSMQYSELPPDRLDLLKRCLPSHGLPARPVDLFETDAPRIWLVRNDRLSLVGLFNWSGNKKDEIRYDMNKLGLNGNIPYAAFDYWANAFVDPVQGTLAQTLPGGTCRILALRPGADHPQVLSTSRHVTQGLMDVLEETWDAANKTLSGTSRLVADDPYELRIALPAGTAWAVKSVSAPGADATAGTPETGGVRVTLLSKTGGDIGWKVVF